jgi:hypothetical protein
MHEAKTYFEFSNENYTFSISISKFEPSKFYLTSPLPPLLADMLGIPEKKGEVDLFASTRRQ